MKFELLPNEIFIECFEYLNGQDIFYSFDRLNCRFNKLIRHIWLHVNFQNVKKAIFDQFCKTILLDPEIKTKICSLKLSNESNTCGQIGEFLSFFSLNKFSHLRSLTLIKVKENEVDKIKSMLPTLSDLCYFCLNDTLHKHDELLSALPLSKIRTLLVRDLSYDLMSIYETISITNLTLFDCSFNDLCQILKYVPMLKYLNAGCMDSDVKDDKFLKTALCLANNQALLLIKLIIRISSITFVDFEMLLKQTPNLSTLILSSSSRHLINAYDWEHFISILLPHLNHFEFKFYIRLIEKDDTDRTIDELFHIFKQFQTDFWHNQHHWYTEYYVHKDMAIIYTIPYISQYFTLTPDRNKHCNILVNNSQSFERVTKLTLSSSALTNNCRHYFSNVQSLHLVNYNSRSINDLCALNPEDIQSIKNIINLSNLKHLDIEDHYSINLSLVLLEMLKQAPQLSSITMRTSSVTLLFDNDQLCQYLNKMIKKLNIKKLAYFYPYIHSNQIEKFCTIFSNIEQLECSIDQLDHLLLLLSHLSKLSNITVNSSCFPDDINLWLHDKTMELKRNYLFEYTEEIFSPENKTLNIWIGENIN